MRCIDAKCQSLDEGSEAELEKVSQEHRKQIGEVVPPAGQPRSTVETPATLIASFPKLSSLAPAKTPTGSNSPSKSEAI
jgi:hypothetical protein